MTLWSCEALESEIINNNHRGFRELNGIFRSKRFLGTRALFTNKQSYVRNAKSSYECVTEWFLCDVVKKANAMSWRRFWVPSIRDKIDRVLQSRPRRWSIFLFIFSVFFFFSDSPFRVNLVENVLFFLYVEQLILVLHGLNSTLEICLLFSSISGFFRLQHFQNSSSLDSLL